MILDNLFKQHEVPLWGIVYLGEAIEGAEGYGCIAFCLPYDSAAVAALPDDTLMNRCRRIVIDARGEYRTFCGLCMQVCPARKW